MKPDELALLCETVAALNPSAQANQRYPPQAISPPLTSGMYIRSTHPRPSPLVPQVHTSERGRVDLAQVLAAATGGGVAEMDEDMEHRRMVEMVKAGATAHGHAEHSHAQHAAPKADSSAAPPGAAEANGHAEVHAHGHADAKAESEPNCTDAEHEHGGGGGGDAAATGETSQAHGHGHVHESRESKRFGITSFCYQRRRPFHPHRLMSVIRQLDVKDTPLQAEATYLPALKGALMGAAAVPAPAQTHVMPSAPAARLLVRLRPRATWHACQAVGPFAEPGVFKGSQCQGPLLLS